MGFSLTVPRLDHVVEPNFARAFLHRAADALNRGDVLSCGVLLREAIRRQCWAECRWYDCLPQGASNKTPPRTLLQALKKAGRCGEHGFDTVKEMIDLGNAAAHCRHVRASYLYAAIVLFHGIIDECPCNEPANLAGNPNPDCEPWDHEDDYRVEGFEPNATYDDDDCDDEGGALVKAGRR